MKTILKRAIGFFEFAFGVTLLVFFFYSLFFTKGFSSLQWKDIIRIPFALLFGGGLIKYGWRWMFNIFDFIDEDELKPDDPYFKEAVTKAQENIDLFLSYLSKNIYDSRVLLPLNKNMKKVKRVWAKAEYLDNLSIKIYYYPASIFGINRKVYEDVVLLTQLEDWAIKKDDVIIGLYTIKALADKANNNGLKLNTRTKEIIDNIVG